MRIVGSALRTWVAGARLRLRIVHGPKNLVCCFDLRITNLELHPTDRVGVQPVHSNEILVLEDRRNPFAFELGSSQMGFLR